MKKYLDYLIQLPAKFIEIKFSRMVNVLENISQELYHLIIQQKNMSRTVSATEVQEEMDIEKALLNIT
ncbi:hypothetical protein Anas_12543 [Armadillidium nasatum]|uniref:Uncharacterized protein n=1 Tax=Armadillidium nasatum TaxID=96803 RepID=A0A5N5T1E8_9CRUS|nr:hypothetical protein Anas_12543 [Armadillidium nasatum]